MPNELEDLPYARYLTRLEDDLEPEGDYDCVHITGADIDDIDAGNSRFSETVFTALAINRGSLRFSRFTDVWQRNVRWVGTDLSDTSWQDVELIAGARSGVDAGGANLRRVRFEGCKFDSVNFRKSKLREVQFVDCVLRHADFGDAELTKLTFPGTTVEGLLLNRARLKQVDLRGAAHLNVAEGLEALRGATITPLQLLDLAPEFAKAIGITVRD
ncbi:pentapeptide repeat-containing protein [Nocardia anaemiae]|uniref:pentapeptide repeat-containing protein n=1 Tax=Nocardia anaemiae TaxID=263910 RepID=UPI0007A54709|nr:pentapeptide repeat-containing protein [Nocardia anaemiae]